MTDRTLARRLAAESISGGKPLEWFETLYREAGDNASVIPWADMTVNPGLATWLEFTGTDGTGRRALVAGCGLGDDAEALAAIGFEVTAFDISATCIEWCRRRFGKSPVEYCIADLFASPSSWERAFDFVLEAYTLQVLPEEIRPEAIRRIARFVAPGGTLLVIARGREPDDDAGTMPWPLLRSELAEFGNAGLNEVRFEDFVDAEEPPVRRFRVEYRKQMSTPT
jgi:ubiquinone/menaquinone biosynthesis C-methylase UbiE